MKEIEISTLLLNILASFIAPNTILSLILKNEVSLFVE